MKEFSIAAILADLKRNDPTPEELTLVGNNLSFWDKKLMVLKPFFPTDIDLKIIKVQSDFVILDCMLAGKRVYLKLVNRKETTYLKLVNIPKPVVEIIQITFSYLGNDDKIIYIDTGNEYMLDRDSQVVIDVDLFWMTKQDYGQEHTDKKLALKNLMLWTQIIDYLLSKNNPERNS